MRPDSGASLAPPDGMTEKGTPDMDDARLMGAIPASNYRKTLVVRAPRERVYRALTTNDGIAGWWTSRVAGVHQPGGVVRMEFAGAGHVIECRSVTCTNRMK